MKHSNEIRNTSVLPEAYQFSHTFDLKKDKKVSLFIQITFIVIALIIVGLALLFRFPVQNELNTTLMILLTFGLVMIYSIIHELTHGAFIHILSKKKPTYEIRFPYLSTGSKAYFTIKSFIVIALAPVVIWGLLLILGLLFVPQDFFLSLYIVLGVNFAGAAGDYIQVYYISKLPRHAIIQDNGTETKVYILKK